MEKRLDIIVFGATGFTGKYVVKCLATLKQASELSLGISGRSDEKLKKLVGELTEMGVDTAKIATFQSDIKDEVGLKVTNMAKVLINCAGPYTDMGEPVVKACIESGTHYVDITAEMKFVLDTYQKFNGAAEKANVLVIPTCGFGSIPGVMAAMYLDKKFGGIIQKIDCYAEIEIPRRAYFPGCNKCLVHYGTWASFVHELNNLKYNQNLKTKLFGTSVSLEDGSGRRPFFHKHKTRCWFPYPGPDEDLIQMTQAYFQKTQNKTPYTFKMSTTMPLKIHFIIIPAIYAYYYASALKCFRYLLWRYPGFFSLGYMTRKGPTEKMMEDTKFCFALNAVGWDCTDSKSSTPNKTVSLKVSGSNPGYGVTAKACAFSAITILKEGDKMPKGGVLAPGAAFYNTDLVESLNANGIKFEITSTGCDVK